MTRSIRSRKNRRGVECIEAAITLPLLVIVTFTTLQLSHQWHVEKLLKIAAYEAMRAGAASDGDSQDAIRVFGEHATALGIANAELVLDENAFNTASVGDLLVCEGTAPGADNGVSSPINVSISATMSGGQVFHRKEGL